MKTSKNLSVRLRGTPLGVLEQTRDGKLRFEYLDEAKLPLSQSMPLTNKRYGNVPCENYFAGLLPENPEARIAIAAKYNANPNNTFSLLSVIGHDCAGAVSLVPTDAPVLADVSHSLKTVPLSDVELEKHIINLPQKPLFLDVRGLRLSLAGVQDKAAVCVVNNKISLPAKDTPTTHILKPALTRFEHTVENEYLCLTAAAQLGIPTPKVEIHKVRSQTFLLVERFDRRFLGNKHIVRIHQEDFCQALSARQKYERFEGPGLKSCFDLLLNSSAPIIDRNKFMEVIVFNFLMGNADAHAKNFALLYDDDGQFSIAPFYDLLCTQIYDGLTGDMSMKVGDQYEFNKVTVKDWESLCKKSQISFPALRLIIDNQSNNLPPTVNDLADDLKNSKSKTAFIAKLCKQIEKNCKTIRRQFGF